MLPSYQGMNETPVILVIMWFVTVTVSQCWLRQEQQQPVCRDSHDAEILEQVPRPLFQGQPAVGGEMSQAEGHAHRGLDQQS